MTEAWQPRDTYPCFYISPAWMTFIIDWIRRSAFSVSKNKELREEDTRIQRYTCTALRTYDFPRKNKIALAFFPIHFQAKSFLVYKKYKDQTSSRNFQLWTFSVSWMNVSYIVLTRHDLCYGKLVARLSIWIIYLEKYGDKGYEDVLCFALLLNIEPIKLIVALIPIFLKYYTQAWQRKVSVE